MIVVVVNGQHQSVAEGTSVEDLVEQLAIGRRGVAVALNAEVVPRSTWGAVLLGAGDEVEVLRAAQGG